ncbi:hypothetical protein [Actinoplanes sp. NPDC049265]|uniref:hypothetical protein n=1 Tax=Actinoplanes sp. NPDC049265 TaxID=3363902 RepID=UPI003715251E
MTPTTPEVLEKLAVNFAEEMSDLLNHTVADGVRLNSVMNADRKLCHLGYGLTRDLVVNRKVFPLRQRDSYPKLYMGVSARSIMDHEQQYLTLRSSVFSLTFDEDGTQEFCHFDYERDKLDGYPESHFQINADSDPMRDFLKECKESEGPLKTKKKDENGRRPRGPRAIKKIHFPAGARRFRTSLEDVVQFLVSEKMVPDLTAAEQQYLDKSRQDFHDLQLRAAVRRRPEVAAEALRSIGWNAEAPQ